MSEAKDEYYKLIEPIKNTMHSGISNYVAELEQQNKVMLIALEWSYSEHKEPFIGDTIEKITGKSIDEVIK